VVNLRTRGPVTVTGSTVRHATLCATAALPTLVAGGSVVSQSILHAGVVVDGGAHVSQSVLCALSGAKRLGIVSECIVGPGTVIHEGEAAHSLIGPLVGFHHHALLIAALWPQGKGA
jgi:ADP-glucose pyrophosphorylase